MKLAAVMDTLEVVVELKIAIAKKDATMNVMGTSPDRVVILQI